MFVRVAVATRTLPELAAPDLLQDCTAPETEHGGILQGARVPHRPTHSQPVSAPDLLVATCTHPELTLELLEITT